MLYFELEPFGSPAIDQYVGLIKHALFQLQAKKELELTPFVPTWGPPREISPEEYKAKAMRKYAGQGGKAAT